MDNQVILNKGAEEILCRVELDSEMTDLKVLFDGGEIAEFLKGFLAWFSGVNVGLLKVLNDNEKLKGYQEGLFIAICFSNIIFGAGMFMHKLFRFVNSKKEELGENILSKFGDMKGVVKRLIGKIVYYAKDSDNDRLRAAGIFLDLFVGFVFQYKSYSLIAKSFIGGHDLFENLVAGPFVDFMIRRFVGV